MEKEKYIEEKELKFQPKAIPTKEMKILLDLIETHICKIESKDGSHGTGFFCNIPNGWGKNITVLMTNNHVLKEEDIQSGQTIKFSINNDYQVYNILIDNNRKTYTNKSYDITIIEIKEDDKINENSFFHLDPQIFKNNPNEIFRNCQIYLLHYPKGVEMEISNGVIKNITENEETIQHLCDTSGGSSGSPIINKNNFQVIGIHKGGAEGAKNYNLGTLLKKPVEKFNEEIKMMKKIINKDNYNNNNIIEKNIIKKWTIYVINPDNNDIYDIEIDNEQTFGEFRNKVSSMSGIPANDLLLSGANEYDYTYNSKKMREINYIYDECTLYQVYKVGSGIKGI